MKLLELAANAASRVWHWDSGVLVLDDCAPSECSAWNPLTDDGDSFRLMVRLGLFVDAYAPATTVGNVVCPTSLACKTRAEDHNGDAYAATRRAIVRAAAEIGKNMQQVSQ